jgi:hypothetical protein
VKFTTYVPIRHNDGTPFDPAYLRRVIDRLWRPFHAMTDEGLVRGRWTAPDGTHFRDTCRKISIACDPARLIEAIRGVKKVGRRLGQEAMYFEVNGYDGVHFLYLRKGNPEGN